MMQIPQSSFLQALACAIINSLWQFALLWLVFFLVNLCCKLSSKQKYSAALLLQLTGFVWFAGTFMFYYQQWNYIFNTTDYANAYSSQFSVAQPSAQSVWLGFIGEAAHYLPYLSIAYLLLLAFLSVKWVQTYLHTKQLKQKGLTKIHVDWRLFVQKISNQLGIQKTVSIYLSDIVKAPLTIGFLKPVILIPLASINHLTTDQMEAVILHELAHIKRFDYLVNLLLTIVEVVMFFNPFMQLLSRQIKRERENSCDDWVLQYEYNAATYAKALLKIALLQTQPQPSFAMNASAKNNHVLLTRVKRMIEKKEKTFHYKHHLLALLFTTLILSFIAWFSHADSKYVAAKTKHTDVLITPMSIQVDNPLFNPVFFLSNTQKDMIEEEQKAVAKEAKIIRHTPVLAIPQTSELVNLDVALPVVLKPTFANVRVDMLAKLNGNIDSAFQNIRVRKLYNPATIVNIEKAEREVRRTLSEVQKNIKMKSYFDKEKVMQAMKAALAQMKAAKQKIAKVNSAKDVVADNISDAEDLSAILKAFENDANMEAYTHALQQQLEEWKQQYRLAQMNDDLSGATLGSMPAVVYTTPASHSYSFEYGDEPTDKAVSITSSSTATRNRAEVRQRILNETVIEKQVTPDDVTTPTPQQSIKKTTKRLYIIHI